MYTQPIEKQKQLPRSISSIYSLGFLLGLHMALPAYLYSTFLSEFVGERYVGAIFTLASLVSILLFGKLPRLLKRWGNFNVTMVSLALALLSTVGLAVVDDFAAVLVLFIINYIAASVLIFNFDIFLEHSSRDTTTGTIRGMYLVFSSIAWVMAQLIASFIVTDNLFGRILLLSSITIVPMFIITLHSFKKFRDPEYGRILTFTLLTSAREKPDIRKAYLVSFLLQFFFVWMVVYTPIYLHHHIGFTWSAIAIMFSIMLLPFVIVEEPLGKIADQLLGEKELMAGGFFIMAITTLAMSWITSTNFLLWTMLLFISRVGASAVEVMSETYFFKHVSDRDVSEIGVFRTVRPWAFVFAPLVASILVPSIGIQYLFLILALIMFYGALRALSLKDTKPSRL